MKHSASSWNLTVLAFLLASSLFTCTSLGGDKVQPRNDAPIGLRGVTVILQADGTAPTPPPPPPKQTSVSASIA
jgi:hypothetical protein